MTTLSILDHVMVAVNSPQLSQRSQHVGKMLLLKFSRSISDLTAHLTWSIWWWQRQL